MIERRIKELAIACEAMARVGELYNEASDTKRLLQGLIMEAEQEAVQARRVARPEKLDNNDDDNIPF